MMESMIPSPVKAGLLGAAAILALSTLWGAYFTVAPNEAVVVTRFGAIHHTAQPGLNFKIPFVDGAATFRTDQQKVYGEKINTYTIDNQELDASFTVLFRIPVDQVERIMRDVPDYRDRIFTMSVDRFKAEMGKVSITDIASKRGEVAVRVLKTVQSEAKRLFGLEVTDFQINGIDYTKQFRDAMDKAAIAKTLVERAEQEKRQAEIDAESAKIKAVGAANAAREQARGVADANLLTATAEAEAIRMRGEAEAKAISAQADALKSNSNLVELRRAEKWNGALPQQVLGQAPIPFFNVK